MTTYRPPESTPLVPPPPDVEGQWVEPQWIEEPAPPAGGTEVEELPERTRRRWWMGPRSLTGRLVTGVVALVVILVLAISACTYFALRSFLVNRLDQQLQTTASSPLNRLFQADTQAGFRSPQEVWAVALSADGTVLNQPSGNADAMNLTAAERTKLAAAASPDSSTLRTTDGINLRVTSRQVTVTDLSTGASEKGVAVIGLSTSEIDRTLHRLILLEWIVGGAAVILAFAATAGGVEFSLRRLRRVTSTAHEVAAELSPSGTGLDRRVAVENDDTTEVGQLAGSFNTLLAAVETQFAARLESEERMRQFLADASHELRTPLTSIRGYAELARMQRDKPGADDDPANLDRIEAEGTRMSRLIDDLLLLARSDQAIDGRENASPVRQYIEVDELLDDVVRGARAAYPTRQIHLDVPPGLVLVGDSDQLHRAVRNLVNNAVVHTRPDGPIGVRAVLDGGDVLIQVADSGPGLPPEEAAHVFERFWRADKARTRARGGSGLGMSIVASIVGAHGGQVRFDSSVESGSTVSIRLPAGLA